MTKGLLKSTFLHLGILMIFVYGAEIFKQNKRFEIYEIPLDIVDISEKTVNKTEVKKKISSQKKKIKDKLILHLLQSLNQALQNLR